MILQVLFNSKNKPNMERIVFLWYFIYLVTSASFQQKLKLVEVVQLFSRLETLGGNSVTESFFATVKKEELYRMNY